MRSRLAFIVTTARALAVLPPGASMPAGIEGEGVGSALSAFVIAIAMLAAILVVVKVVDLRQKREAAAVSLQGLVSDALLQDPTLTRLPVTVTVHIPLWRGSPAQAEVHGAVPSPWLREAVLRLVEREARRQRADVHVDDRLVVLPPVATHAA